VNQEQLVAGRRSLAEVREQFEIWRGQRKRGGRIPRLLWQAAAGLSDRYSAAEIVTALRVDGGRLEQQIRCLSNESQRPEARSMEFISVGALPMASADVVELEDETGRRLKVHLLGATASKVIEVAKGLWEQAG